MEAHSSNKQKIQHSLRRILVALLVTIAILHIASVVVASSNITFLQGIAPKFDVDNEFNFPTVYNGFLWGCAAFMILLVGIQARQRLERWRWYGLAAFFLYVGFDDVMVIHESAAKPIRNLLNIHSGLFYHAWVIAAIGITLLLGVVYASIRLSKNVSLMQKQMLRYVVTLGVGAIFFEVIGTQLYFSQVVYKLGPVLLEEMFEMGMASFILYQSTGYLIDSLRR